MFEGSDPAVRKSSHLRRLLAAAAMLLAPGAAPAAEPARPQPVDLELILAVDVSGSIDPGEAELQRQGYMRALLDPEVVRAIKSGPSGKIALVYVEWAGLGHHKTVVDWSIIDGAEAAKAFTNRLGAQPIESAHRTSLSEAIDRSVPMFAANAFEGARRIIDISGDGANNYGRLVTEARDAAVKEGIVINGLPILANTAGGIYPTPPDLDLFFRDCVIGGPGAFYVVAHGFDDFARAVRKKLIIEIAGATPPERVWRAAEDKREGPPCNIGELRWMSIIQGKPLER
jgi:hypothetical protein